MSKRAKELAEKILDTNFDAPGAMTRRAVEAIALIDAELRKEREACAWRLRRRYYQLVETEEYEDDEIADTWNRHIVAECCAAILKAPDA
jgi:hypothetical protein